MAYTDGWCPGNLIDWCGGLIADWCGGAALGFLEVPNVYFTLDDSVKGILNDFENVLG